MAVEAAMVTSETWGTPPEILPLLALFFHPISSLNL